jgi:hypothetical protein
MPVLCSGFWRKNQKTEEQGKRERDAAGHECILQGCGLKKDNIIGQIGLIRPISDRQFFDIIFTKPNHEEKDHEFPEA